MKNVILILIFIFTFISAYSQTDEEIKTDISRLQNSVRQLQKNEKEMQSNLDQTQLALRECQITLQIIHNKADSNALQITRKSEELGGTIATNQNDSQQKIALVNQSVQNKTLYLIIALLCVTLISLSLFYYLKRNHRKANACLEAQSAQALANIMEQLNQTRTTIEENLIKEISKQTTLLEQQMDTLQAPQTPIDHSLALKVADEITLIERNLSLMDSTVKGHKQLMRSVSKLKDNLSANGYDMPELLGKKFNEGMKVMIINANPDENLAKDEEIITKIIKPQVNYQDKMIQAAQIEVSVGY